MYYKNLEDLIFKRHKQNNADELLILGGFIGVYPIEKMSKESIKTTLNRKRKSTFRSRSESFKTERLYKKCESIKAKTTHAKPQTNDHSEEIIIR